MFFTFIYLFFNYFLKSIVHLSLACLLETEDLRNRGSETLTEENLQFLVEYSVIYSKILSILVCYCDFVVPYLNLQGSRNHE